MLKGQITTDRVRSALEHSGYTVEFLKSTFEGFTKTGNERHKFFFVNEDTGLLDCGDVYVWDHRGELYGDW